jgi:hypothetical protein
MQNNSINKRSFEDFQNLYESNLSGLNSPMNEYNYRNRNTDSQQQFENMSNSSYVKNETLNSKYPKMIFPFHYPTDYQRQLLYPDMNQYYKKSVFQPIAKTPKTHFNNLPKNFFYLQKSNESKNKKLSSIDLNSLLNIFIKIDSLKANKNNDEVLIKITEILQKADFSVKKLFSIETFLLKFLKGEEISNDMIEQLNDLEKILVTAFLVKKKYIDVDFLEFNTKSIKFLQERGCRKRTEQEYKTVLKKAFKQMISIFNQKNLIFDSKKTHFYKHYFGEILDRLNIPIENIELEYLFNERKNKSTKRKSKKNYAQILKTSSKFMNDLNDYLNNSFKFNEHNYGSLDDAKKDIENKVPDIVMKWKKEMIEAEDLTSLSKLLLKFFTNKKIKLPWSYKEISKAIGSVKNLLLLK